MLRCCYRLGNSKHNRVPHRALGQSMLDPCIVMLQHLSHVGCPPGNHQLMYILSPLHTKLLQGAVSPTRDQPGFAAHYSPAQGPAVHSALPDWRLATTSCSAKLRLGLFWSQTAPGRLACWPWHIFKQTYAEQDFQQAQANPCDMALFCCRQTVSCTSYWISSMVATFFSSCIDR